MEYVAMIGLLFAPIVCLLCAAWFYVRWKNEHEDQELALRDRKTCFIFLIAAVPGDLRRAEAPVPLHGVKPQCPKKIPGLTASAAGPGDFFTFR